MDRQTIRVRPLRARGRRRASVNAGVKTPPGSRCEFFSFTLCVLKKCDGGLKVLRRGQTNHDEQ